MSEISIRPLAESDLGEADRVFRLAFGTQLGLADRMSFRGDAEMVKSRWRTDREGALAAFRGGELVGSAFSARWGRFGIFGPISIRPDCWSAGIGKRLLDPAMALFDQWGIEHVALFTFPHSPKHVALYQKYGFWPQCLTFVMAKTAEKPAVAVARSLHSQEPLSFSECAALTASILPGLEVEREIRAVHDQGLGDTVALREGGRLQGLAICHVGKGSEAGSGSTYVKFAAVRPGADAARLFERLATACEAFALERNTPKIIAGMNSARHAAYRSLLARGYKAFFQGVAMQRPNLSGYNTPDRFVIDDWR